MLIHKQFMTILIIFCALTLTNSLAQTAVPPSGTGSKYKPYQIDSLENLYWISQKSSIWNDDRYFEQNADIDASDTKNWGTSGFKPIGDGSKKFNGYYNGKGHRITGLYINRPSTNYVGLFGFISKAKIDSLGVQDVDLKGYKAVGGLVGASDSNSHIRYSYSTGSIQGLQMVGGFVGYSGYGSTISLCYSTGNVQGSQLVGGFVGYNYNHSTLFNNYSTGNVKGDSYVGGFVGWNYYYSMITYSYSTGNVQGHLSTSGGFAGENGDHTSIDYAYWDTQTSGASNSDGGKGLTTTAMKQKKNFKNWNFSTTWQITSTLNNGYPSLIWQNSLTNPSSSSSTQSSSSQIQSSSSDEQSSSSQIQSSSSTQQSSSSQVQSSSSTQQSSSSQIQSSSSTQQSSSSQVQSSSSTQQSSSSQVQSSSSTQQSSSSQIQNSSSSSQVQSSSSSQGDSPTHILAHMSMHHQMTHTDHSLKISYTLSQKAFIDIAFYDLLGKEIFRHHQRSQKADHYEIVLNTSAWKAGRYVSILFMNGKPVTSKSLLIH